MIIGFMLFFVMRAMGEILLSNLNYKSFSDFAGDLLGPWAGFFTGLVLLVLLGCLPAWRTSSPSPDTWTSLRPARPLWIPALLTPVEGTDPPEPPPREGVR